MLEQYAGQTDERLLQDAFKDIDVGHLDFISLLKSGIPLDLPDNKKLFIGFLGKKNKCIGTLIKDYCLNKEEKSWEIAGILRDQHLIIPHSNTELKEMDQVIIFGTKSSVEKLKEKIKRIQ